MLLKKGSTGEDVKTLQRKLNLTEDGDFGYSTEAAVKQWQKEHGLIPDGIVGNKTWNSLIDISQSSPALNLIALQGVLAQDIIDQIPLITKRFNLTSNLRLAHFLGQASHESGDFTVKVENLHYSANRLLQIFPTYFKTLEKATAYANQPEKIANLVYSNRMGNGDENSGDGWKYKGKGYLQITGRDNHKALSDDMGIDFIANPDLIATQYPLVSAGWFFSRNNLWTICDMGIDRITIEKLTKRINGGLNGIEDRVIKTNKYSRLLSD